MNGQTTQCSSWKFDNVARCRHRRLYFFNHYFFRIFSLLFLLLLFIFVSSSNYSFLSMESGNSRKSVQSTVRVMYVVRTVSKYYSSRLISLLETWISLVHEDVFFVSDVLIPNIKETNIILTEKVCGPTSHTIRSLCCQTIHDFILYRRHASNYDWFCHFDDDQYVHVNNLRKYLSTLNPDRPYYIGRNSWQNKFKRRKNVLHPNPFWFATLGAGVCFSKGTLPLLEPYTQTVLQFVNGCIHEYYPDDIYLGFLINNRLNLSFTKNDQFHSHLEYSFFDDKQRFINEFDQQITFGFKLPRTVPRFLPHLFPIDTDPLRMRALHCFVYPQFKDCPTRLRNHIFNTTQ